MQDRYPVHVDPGRETRAELYADIALFAANQGRDPGGRIRGEIQEDLFYQVVHLLHEDGEIEYEHLFVDGSKIEANANRYTFVWRKRVEKGIAKLAGKQEK